MVFWSRDLLLFSFKNCLGYSDLESGHSLVPEPPARMTGKLFSTDCCMFVSLKSAYKVGQQSYLIEYANKVPGSKFNV